MDTSHVPTNYDLSYTVGGSTLDNVMVIGVVPEPGGIAVSLMTLGFCLMPPVAVGVPLGVDKAAGV